VNFLIKNGIEVILNGYYDYLFKTTHLLKALLVFIITMEIIIIPNIINSTFILNNTYTISTTKILLRSYFQRILVITISSKVLHHHFHLNELILGRNIPTLILILTPQHILLLHLRFLHSLNYLM